MRPLLRVMLSSPQCSAHYEDHRHFAARSNASFTDHGSISQHITDQASDEIASGARATPLSSGKTAWTPAMGDAAPIPATLRSLSLERQRGHHPGERH